MSGISIQATDDISPLLDRVQTAAGRKGMAVEMARVGQQLTREHLFGLDRARHRHGRHYYAQAARATHAEVTPQGVLISISQVGIRQRYYGGTIKPRKGKYLTLPAHQSAYGKRAGEFNDLEFKLVEDPTSGRVRPALVRRVSRPTPARSRGRSGSRRVTTGEATHGRVMYWLVRKVTQSPDPTVLPEQRLIVRTLREAGIARINRIARRQGGSAS